MIDATPNVTQAGFANRLRALLPDGWFPSAPASGEAEQAPVLNAILQGCASVYRGFWLLLEYIYPQQRLSTATGAMLDIYAQDFFGDELPRYAGESDDSYRERIKNGIVPLRFTRPAVEAAITGVRTSGWALVEPRNANDTKGIASKASPSVGGGYAYGSRITGANIATPGNPCLRYGTNLAPFQGFVLLDDLSAGTPPEDVTDAINRVRAAGVVFWIQ